MRELERQQPVKPPTGGLAIIGPGRVGQAIARAAGDTTQAVLAGREDHAVAAAGAECVLLCVPDQAIAAAAAVTARAQPVPRFIGHVSGATGLEALRPAADAGSEPFSLHPLQTIPGGETDLHGVPAAISARSSAGLDYAGRLARSLGMRPFELDEDARAAYHAAASMASNFLITLEESAAQILDHAGVQNGRELLTPLVMTTARNWAEQGAAALTGPIARGDESTVTRHLDALARIDADLLETYRVLARRTRALAADPSPDPEPVS